MNKKQRISIIAAAAATSMVLSPFAFNFMASSASDGVNNESPLAVTTVSERVIKNVSATHAVQATTTSDAIETVPASASKIHKTVDRSTFMKIADIKLLAIAAGGEGARVLNAKLDLFDMVDGERVEVSHFDVKVKTATQIIDMDLDAVTGAVLSKEVKEIDALDQDDKEHSTAVMITSVKAGEIALAKVGTGATISSNIFDNDGHPAVFEVKVLKDGIEYELEIHAISGAILDFEKESMNTTVADDDDDDNDHNDKSNRK
jgi:uncharacterized membrane protein YkoI